MGSGEVKVEMIKSVLLFVSFLGFTLSLTCYKCKQIDVVDNTCSNKEGQSQWCGEEENDIQWCIKTYENYKGIEWRCAQQGEEPEDGYEGCMEEKRSNSSVDTICYCDTDLCNMATTPTSSLIIISFL